MNNVHFAIPEIYGETLSYYELLRKLVNKTNELIENYNTVPEQIAEEVKKLDASQVFSTVLNWLIHSIATDNTKSKDAVKQYKKHDLLYATFNDTVNLYEAITDFTNVFLTELKVDENIREVNISDLLIELRNLIDTNKNNIESVTAVANQNSEEIETIHNDITGIENKNNEQDTELSTLRTMLSSPYNYKGEVSSLSALPASGNVNDTYYVQDVKYKVTWTGSAWMQSSLSEADYQTELSELKGDLNHISNIIGDATVADQYVNPKTMKENTYWETAGTLGTLPLWQSFEVIRGLKAGTYYFCGVNPMYSWVVNKTNNSTVTLGSLYSWNETDYYKKHSVTINYDFDLYLSRQSNYKEVTKFSSKDFEDTFSYGTSDISLIESIKELQKEQEKDFKVYPLILTDDTVMQHLSDVNNAEDNTLYRMSINNVIDNLPPNYTTESYYLITITNAYDGKLQKKQLMLTVNGGINVKWVRLFQDTWLPWKKINTNPSNEDTRTIVYVGANETYKNINSALNAITDNSEDKKYKIIVKSGTYDVPSNEPYFGVKNFVDIQGEDKSTVIVRNIYSTNSYDASRATFDPQRYNESIMSANISNMTIISQGCKCPIHIDGNNIANGGNITIDNCILMDLNTPSNYNTTNRLTRIGGVNCGLGNGQSVTVKNTISNGTLYAHNHSATNTPSTFTIDKCTCRGTLIGCAYETDVKDNYIITNSTLDYVAIQKLYATSNKYNVVMSNNNINYIFAPDNDNITDPYYTFDLFFGGKCGIPDTSCMKLMFNCTSITIPRGSIVYSKSDDNNRGWLSDEYISGTGTNFAGVAMEDIPANSVGWVQHRGKISIPDITSAKYGDLLDFVNGNFVAHQTGNVAIAKYAEISPLYANQHMIILID